MNEQTSSANTTHEQTPCCDAAECIRALRDEGAPAIDPVGFHYLETLARRAQNHQGRVGRILQDRLMAAILAFKERTRAAQSKARLADRTPILHDQESLRGLVDRLSPHRAVEDFATRAGSVVSRPELKSVQHFRKTWSRLSIEKQVAHAFAQAPRNAGPLNSHVVALRALAQMRDISPDYLNRFLSYVDTLARLDQSGTGTSPDQKSSVKVNQGNRKRAAQ